MMTDRCIDGRLMRHKPFADDPNYEHDVGECPQCKGGGCGTHGSPELDADAAKLAAMGADPGPTLEAFDELSALHERLELAVKRAERAEARLSGFKLVYVHSLRTLVPENLLPLVEKLQARAEDAERQLRELRAKAQADCL